MLNQNKKNWTQRQGGGFVCKEVGTCEAPSGDRRSRNPLDRDFC